MDTKLYILTGNIYCYLEGSKKYGDDGMRDTPVPIPNTEVKPHNADGTRRETSRETRKSPNKKAVYSFEWVTLNIYLEKLPRDCQNY